MKTRERKGAWQKQRKQELEGINARLLEELDKRDQTVRGAVSTVLELEEEIKELE